MGLATYEQYNKGYPVKKVKKRTGKKSPFSSSTNYIFLDQPLQRHSDLPKAQKELQYRS